MCLREVNGDGGGEREGRKDVYHIIMFSAGEEEGGRGLFGNLSMRMSVNWKGSDMFVYVYVCVCLCVCTCVCVLWLCV